MLQPMPTVPQDAPQDAPQPLAGPEAAATPADSTPAVAPAAVPTATASSCGNADVDCLKDTDNTMRQQLEAGRLATMKTMRDGGSYAANRAKTRAFISMGMSDDARRELGCDKARKAAKDADQDGDAAWYACDIAGLRSALAGANRTASVDAATPDAAPVASATDMPAPVVAAPLEAVSAEAN